MLGTKRKVEPRLSLTPVTNKVLSNRSLRAHRREIARERNLALQSEKNKAVTPSSSLTHLNDDEPSPPKGKKQETKGGEVSPLQPSSSPISARRNIELNQKPTPQISLSKATAIWRCFNHAQNRQNGLMKNKLSDSGGTSLSSSTSPQNRITHYFQRSVPLGSVGSSSSSSSEQSQLWKDSVVNGFVRKDTLLPNGFAHKEGLPGGFHQKDIVSNGFALPNGADGSSVSNGLFLQQSMVANGFAEHDTLLAVMRQPETAVVESGTAAGGILSDAESEEGGKENRLSVVLDESVSEDEGPQPHSPVPSVVLHRIQSPVLPSAGEARETDEDEEVSESATHGGEQSAVSAGYSSSAKRAVNLEHCGGEATGTSAFSKLKMILTPKGRGKGRKVKNAANGTRPMTDYFPSIRRSSRKPASALQAEQLKDWEAKVLSEVEEGMKVHHFAGKGRGVVASRFFQKGEYVVEYAGDLVNMREAQERETKYAKDRSRGCFMYYFEDKNVQWCVDASKETARFGRLINHSRTKPNLVTKTLSIKGLPRLVLFAAQDIPPGEELLYDYGDRSKNSLEAHPWLAY